MGARPIGCSRADYLLYALLIFSLSLVVMSSMMIISVGKKFLQPYVATSDFVETECDIVNITLLTPGIQCACNSAADFSSFPCYLISVRHNTSGGDNSSSVKYEEGYLFQDYEMDQSDLMTWGVNYLCSVYSCTCSKEENQLAVAEFMAYVNRFYRDEKPIPCWYEYKDKLVAYVVSQKQSLIALAGPITILITGVLLFSCSVRIHRNFADG